MRGDGKELAAVGLMSGTSMDGVDAAVLVTDGREAVRFGATARLPYDAPMRALLRRAVQRAAMMTCADERDALLSETEEAVTRWHADAIVRLREAAGGEAAQVDVIGFHGQTVLHRPDCGFTVQLGDGDMLARLTGCPVVNDFRSNDMRHGGQGAPFAPAYHMALAQSIDLRPVAFLNLGGVANVTWIGEGDPIAFDTGPANGLLDQWMLEHTGLDMDGDGETALRGTVDAAALAKLCADPYFEAPPPKSLDRFDFTLDAVRGLGVEDGAATLAAFTAEAVARAAPLLPARPRLWIACGGGRRNPALMRALRERLDGEVKTAEDAGLRGDSIEAEAFAYLAVRSLKGLPLSFPTTTGVKASVSGGVLHRAPWTNSVPAARRDYASTRRNPSGPSSGVR